jgi:hypothetical protein
MEEVKDRPFVVLDKYTLSNIKIRFECNVDGHMWSATPSHIIQGHGCPKCGFAKVSQLKRRHNIILEDHGGWVLIDTSTKKYPNTTCKIDKLDFDNIKVKAKIVPSKIGYPLIAFCSALYTVHKVLNPAWKMTDHINGIKTDNRRCNLRECTRAQNNRNRHKSTKNTSGTIGVSPSSNGKKWIARIVVNYEQICLGEFVVKQNAIIARKLAEQVHFGAFAPQHQ